MENTEAMKFAAAGFCLALVVAGCGSTKTVTVTNVVTTTVTKTVSTGPCTASDLTATLDAVAGSAGAGNIVYALKIKNGGSSACDLTITSFQLLDSSGADNPTNVQPPPAANIGAGESLGYNARFSPDVNGTGDNTNGPCQPTSATLRITLGGGGTVDAPISPPTSVCEKGSMTLTTA